MNNSGINENKIFKPQPWRWFFFHWPINSAAFALSWTTLDLISGRQNYLTTVPAIFAATALVHLLLARYSDKDKITISESEILGGWKKGKRIIIPLTDIDRSRSFKKTFFGKLLGFDHIYSESGQKIYVESISLGGEQVAQIKSILKI